MSNCFAKFRLLIRKRAEDEDGPYHAVYPSSCLLSAVTVVMPDMIQTLCLVLYEYRAESPFSVHEAMFY